MLRSKKKKGSSRSSAMSKADRAFSLYIRTRDAQAYSGTHFKCISCGRILPIEKADCGHYVNRQHMALRFSELNCNAQCAHCNRFDEGNATGYRKGLIDKIGEQKVELLEAQKHTSCKLSTFEIEAIAKYYKEEVSKFKYQIR